MKEYKKDLYILKSEAMEIDEAMVTTAIMGEEETITHTVKFPDGKEMDIKCCGSDDSPAWSEAVLFDEHGCGVCYSEPSDEFLGEWELEYEDVIYKVEVMVENNLVNEMTNIKEKLKDIIRNAPDEYYCSKSENEIYADIENLINDIENYLNERE